MRRREVRRREALDLMQRAQRPRRRPPRLSASSRRVEASASSPPPLQVLGLTHVSHRWHRDRVSHRVARLAGAVAAGHWDPWARPVEYELKKVNRSAGTLSTMFVRGETMGGTISQPAEPATAPKKAKKAGKEEAAAKAKANAAPSADAFNWKKAIKSELRAVRAAGQPPPPFQRALHVDRSCLLDAGQRQQAQAEGAPTKGVRCLRGARQSGWGQGRHGGGEGAL